MTAADNNLTGSQEIPGNTRSTRNTGRVSKLKSTLLIYFYELDVTVLSLSLAEMVQSQSDRV